MKKFNLLILLFLSITLFSCKEAGTLEKLTPNDSEIEVFKYYYRNDSYVYVSRFKDNPNVVTTTWSESTGKTTVQRRNVTIYENDSIQVILKK